MTEPDADPRPSRRRTVAANTATVALVVLCLLVLADLTDVPLLRGHAAGGLRNAAALAIRDDVTPFQKWGTREFTLPELERCYADVTYLTQGCEGTWSRFEVDGRPGTLGELLAAPSDVPLRFRTAPSGEVETCRLLDRHADLVAALTGHLERHEAVDLFLLAHTNEFHLWVAEVPEHLRRRIRLVYNSGCNDAAQAPIWASLGARTYVGHRGTSDHSASYVWFLRRWTHGATAAEATQAANVRAERLCRRIAALPFVGVDGDALWEATEALCSGDGDVRLGDAP